MSRISERQRLRGFLVLARGLERLFDEMPNDAGMRFERTRTDVELEIPAKSPRHRRLYISASPGWIEYEFGSLWGEGSDTGVAAAREYLALCDAIIAGGVREVRDVQTGLLYQIFRIRTRGLNKYARDSQFALRHYLREKVRRVRITRIPPLVSP